MHVLPGPAVARAGVASARERGVHCAHAPAARCCLLRRAPHGAPSRLALDAASARHGVGCAPRLSVGAQRGVRDQRTLRGRRTVRVCAAVTAAAAPAAVSSLAVVLASVTAALHSAETAVLQAFVQALTATFELLRRVAYDPWGLEEIVFIVAWVLSVRPLLKAAHAASCTLRTRAAHAWGRRPLDDPYPFERSLLGRVATPLRQLGWAFLALWLFDNSCAVMELAGHAVDRAASPLLAGLPAAIYCVWGGYALLHLQAQLFEEAAVGMLSLQRAAALTTVLGTAAAVCSAIGMQLSTLLGIGGLLGFAVSLAVRDVLTNLFSGISLALHKPFVEGDEITFGAQNVFRVTARVVKLGYFQTVLRDAESQLIYVPNSALTNQTISNAGRRSHTRVQGELLARHVDAAKLERLLDGVAAALRTLPQIDERAAPVAVTISQVTPGGVTVRFSAMFARAGGLGRDALRSKAWLAIGRAFEREGCQFAGDDEGAARA